MTCFVTSLGQWQGRTSTEWVPIGGTVPGVQFERRPAASVMPIGWSRLQSVGGTLIRGNYYGGAADSNGNNDGFFRVPVSGRYHVTVELQGSRNAEVQLTTGLGFGGQASASFVGGWTTVHNTSPGWVVSAVFSEVVELLGGFDYCAFSNSPTYSYTLFGWKISVAWVGTK
jgi:hypothetical protein